MANGQTWTAYRQEVIERVWELLALTKIALPRPGVPFCDLLHHGVMVRRFDLTEKVENGPEGLNLRHERCLNGVDLAQDGEGTLALLGEGQWNDAAVKSPVSLYFTLRVLQHRSLGQKRQLPVDRQIGITVDPFPVMVCRVFLERSFRLHRKADLCLVRIIKHGEVVAPTGAHDDVVGLDCFAGFEDQRVLFEDIQFVPQDRDVASVDCRPEVWERDDS